MARSGFTGDLGYEVLVEHDAVDVWDAIVAAGRAHGLLPIGQIALMMARIEAGLLLIDVDFESSRFAENNEHRSTPLELGFGWMLPGIDDGPTVHRTRRDPNRASAEVESRWKMMGLVVDWQDYDAKYTAAGLIPPKDQTPSCSTR